MRCVRKIYLRAINKKAKYQHIHKMEKEKKYIFGWSGQSRTVLFVEVDPHFAHRSCDRYAIAERTMSKKDKTIRLYDCAVLYFYIFNK